MLHFLMDGQRGVRPHISFSFLFSSLPTYYVQIHTQENSLQSPRPFLNDALKCMYHYLSLQVIIISFWLQEHFLYSSADEQFKSWHVISTLNLEKYINEIMNFSNSADCHCHLNAM